MKNKSLQPYFVFEKYSNDTNSLFLFSGKYPSRSINILESIEPESGIVNFCFIF